MHFGNLFVFMVFVIRDYIDRAQEDGPNNKPFCLQVYKISRFCRGKSFYTVSYGKARMRKKCFYVRILQR